MIQLKFAHTKTLGLPFITLACLLLTFPPLSFSIFVWIAFVPLLIFTLRQPKPLTDFLVWYTVGLLYWAIGVDAVVAAYGVEMYVKMIVAAALPMGILGTSYALSVRLLRNRRPILLLCIPGIVWVLLLNFFRLTPIQTMPLEVFFGQPLPLMQITILGNMDLLIFIILTTNTVLAHLLVERTRTHVQMLGACVIVIVSFYVWGTIRLHQKPIFEGAISIALIQSNFPLSMEWREENAEYILENYRTWAAEADAHGVEMIVFPEYNLSRILTYDETVEFFSSIARQTQATVITGTYSDMEKTPDGKEGQYNIALAFTQTGMLQPVYATNINLPFREIGELFKETYDPVETPAGKAGLFVCYDNSARSVAQKWQAAGADYFVVMTNPSTFAGPIITGLQFIQDHLRAIESHTTVVRVATNGPSAILDPYGRVLAHSRRGEQTILYGTIPDRAQ